MKQIIYLLIAFIICSGYSFSADLVKKTDAKSFITTTSKKELKYSHTATTQATEEYLSLNMNQKGLKETFETPFKDLYISNFPVSPTENANIILKKSYGVINAETKWTLGTKNGDLPTPAPKITFYEGMIEGEPGSKVFIAYFSNSIVAAVEHKEGQIFDISPDYENRLEAAGGAHKLFAHGIFNGANLSTYEPCGIKEYDGHEHERPLSKNEKDEIQKTDLLVVPAVIEGSSDYYVDLFQMDLEKAQAYIASIMALASKIYQEQVNVTFSLVEVKIWEPSEDPYIDVEDIGDKLNTMPKVWPERPSNRALTVLFTKQISQSGLFVGGIAMGGTPYEGNLCNRSRGYCVLGITSGVSYPEFNYTWDVSVAAHEMGHVFGAPHTHNCYYAPNLIDTCIVNMMDACYSNINRVPRLGTIMSYCHLSNSTHSVGLYFHDRDRPLVRAGASNAKTTCVKPPAVPTIFILYPLGKNVLNGGQTINIRWTSQNVNNVNLYYSADNGANWNQIASNIPAADSIFPYELPSAATTQALIKIANAADENVYDLSLISFKVESAGIVVNNPVKDGRYGQLSQIGINWTASSSINSVNLQYTSNNGQSWNNIANGISSNNYTWDVPDIESNQMQIKVISANQASVFGVSGLFSVGKETAKIIWPSAATDSMCINGDYFIQFTSDFLEKFDLWLSIDNGANWTAATPFGAPVTTKTNPYKWRVRADKPSAQTLLKITPDGYDNIELDRTDNPFTVYPCAVSVDEKTSVSNIKVNEISPNPASDKVLVKFELNNDYSTSPVIKIVDLLGKTVYQRNVENSSAGLVSVELDVNNLPAGNYYILISTLKETLAQPLNIAR